MARRRVPPAALLVVGLALLGYGVIDRSGGPRAIVVMIVGLAAAGAGLGGLIRGLDGTGD